MSCMLCKRTGGNFNIYTIYGTAKYTARDYILKIFGEDAETCLRHTDCICSVCMYVLESVVILKRRLWQVISNENRECKPKKLGKIWELFATLKVEKDEKVDDEVSCTTPTSNLLTLSYSRDYNGTLEHQIAIRERNRSLTSATRASSGFGRSDVSEVDYEVKRKKRGRPKKKTRSAPLELMRRGEWNRSFSPLSDGVSPPPTDEDLYDGQGRLTRKRTRSVSREQEKKAKYLEQMDTLKFYCPEKNCSLYFEELAVLNEHMILYHNALALHYCDECQKKYTRSELLKLHKKSHDNCPFWCPLCLTEVKNQEALQKHLGEHATYSVPCKYCDKSFLNKALCENHVKSAHAGKRERITYKSRIIIDRIDKDKSNNNIKEQVNKSEASNNPKQLRIFMSPFTDVEWSYKELDVTEENLKLMNVDFAKQVNLNTNSDVHELIEPETVKKPVAVL